MQCFFPTALFFVVIIVCFNPVVSIKCYVCSSVEDPECKNADLNSSFVQECPRRPSAIGQYCRKISQQLLFKKERKVSVFRECAYEKNTKQCYKMFWVNAAYQETCECDEDLCNKSPKLIDGNLATYAYIIPLCLLLR